MTLQRAMGIDVPSTDELNEFLKQLTDSVEKQTKEQAEIATREAA